MKYAIEYDPALKRWIIKNYITKAIQSTWRSYKEALQVAYRLNLMTKEL